MPVFYHQNHGPDFSSGSTRVPKEGEKFVRGHPVEPFSDIVGNRKRGPVELPAKARCEESAVSFKKVEHLIVESRARFPGGQFVKMAISGH